MDIRERLLTRQIDVLANSSPRPNAKSHGGRPLHLIDQMKFLSENEAIVLEHIRSLGRFNIDNYKFYTDPTFAIEDYICPDIDHELMYKCLKGRDETELIQPVVDEDNAVVLDFSGQLIGRLNEQRIVHMTVEQSQELLDHQSNSLRKFEQFMSGDVDMAANNLRNVVAQSGGDEKIANMLIDNLNECPKYADTEDVKSPTETQQLPKPSTKKSKRKIKINQYNGTINLRNISNLTINTSCSRDNASSKPVLTPSSVDDQPTSYGCDFYNRLLKEIKHSLNSPSSTSPSSSTSGTSKTSPTTPSSFYQSPGTTPTTSPPFDCNRMLFQNIRNLKINLPAVRSSPVTNSTQPPTESSNESGAAAAADGDEQPVQIEQWLKQIITQTELEPAPPSADILEHSIITGPKHQGIDLDIIN